MPKYTNIVYKFNDIIFFRKKSLEEHRSELDGSGFGKPSALINH